MYKKICGFTVLAVLIFTFLATGVLAAGYIHRCEKNYSNSRGNFSVSTSYLPISSDRVRFGVIDNNSDNTITVSLYRYEPSSTWSGKKTLIATFYVLPGERNAYNDYKIYAGYSCFVEVSGKGRASGTVFIEDY